MFATLIAVVLCASTDVGSTWSWSVEDTRQVSLKPTPRGARLVPEATLGKSTLHVKVLEVGSNGPRKLQLTVKDGPATLRGSVWEVESNYGDILSRRVTNAKFADGLPMPQTPQEAELMTAARLLFLPDPLVEAAAQGCTPEANAAMLKATARAVERVYSRTEQSPEITGEAKCGKTPGSYDVRFNLSHTVRDDAVVIEWRGTVTVPRGATHATLQLTGSCDSPLTLFKQPTRINLRSTLRSSVTPKK